ncbi:hypothetical protein [Pantoea sp. 1.19]|uniref:hypothetical protein n=1 Tax=Pantoea sp. 1.19 TaxID=1925589 RepID=UPI0011152296|nr:hypothetical protein [Pantoea sp. 1.19]
MTAWRGGVSCLCLWVGLATASTPQAWRSADHQMVTACLQASALRAPRVDSTIMPFDDAVGWSALLLTAGDPHASTPARAGRELCLWQRHSGKVAVMPVASPPAVSAALP